jgi:hypothetical protein
MCCYIMYINNPEFTTAYKFHISFIKINVFMDAIILFLPTFYIYCYVCWCLYWFANLGTVEMCCIAVQYCYMSRNEMRLIIHFIEASQSVNNRLIKAISRYLQCTYTMLTVVIFAFLKCYQYAHWLWNSSDLNLSHQIHTSWIKLSYSRIQYLHLNHTSLRW